MTGVKVNTTQGDGTKKSPEIFLSYAAQDLPIAQLLAMRLQNAGLRADLDTSLSIGVNWQKAVERLLKSSDYLLFLCSEAAWRSSEFASELRWANELREFADRDITLIPIRLDNASIPPPFANLQYLDLRTDPLGAIDTLVQLLNQTVELNFSALDPLGFENLINDLLIDLGSLSLQRDVVLHGQQFDFHCLFQSVDPFGARKTENWIVEVKHYSSSRLSVSALSEILGRAARFGQTDIRFALITSGQITSAGRERIAHTELRLVEGVELKRILLTRPHLIAKHLGLSGK
ncbi:MAG: hypothetical protein B7Z26_04515 [Asticcacaulis sp. 32-58-5]|nr:MAG: hypothetical protein B7Z26_04515 [Asticcacaulis sp. 32-58-5]